MRKLKLFFACLLMTVLSIGQVYGAVYFEDTFSDVGTGSSGNILPRTGWSGSGTTAPQANTGVRIGASSSGATLTKSAMSNIDGTKNLKVTIYVARYSSNANTLTVTATNGAISDKTGVGTLSAGTLTISPSTNAGVTSTTAAATWTDDYKTEFIITGASASTTISFASNKRLILGPVTIEDAPATTTPTIGANPGAAAFGTKNIYYEGNKSGSIDVAVSGSNLTGNITAALSGDDASMFSISGAPFAPEAGSASGTLTVSYEVTAAGDYSASLTLSSDGAESVVLPITLTATNVAPTLYNRVQSAAALSAGAKIIIVNEEYKKAAGAISGTLLSIVDITDALDATNGELSITEEAVQVFTLGGEAGAWTLTSAAGQLSSVEAKKMLADGETTWAITISSGDAAPVSSTAAAGTLQYNDNSGNGRFTTYTSTQKPVQFYAKADGKQNTGLAYDAADQKKLVKLGDAFTAPTLANPNNLTGITYASSDATVVEVNSSTGAIVEIKKAGVVVITASRAEDDTYKAGSASYTIGVTTHAGTEADPYVAADVKIAIDAMGTVENAYATGVVSNVVTTELPSDGYITFYFSADGLTSGQQVEAYKCYGLNSAPFEAVTDVVTGATVVVTGTLKKYNSTYEFDQNCHLVSYEAPAAPKQSIANEQSNPYTVAQAITFAADGVTYDLDDYVYVQGVVYDVKSFSEGVMNIFIKDANAENQFELYKCAGINDGNATTPFEALTDVQVGNIVIGYGQLTVYNTTYEFKQGNYLVDLQKPVTGVELDATAEVEEGSTVNLTATILPSNATGTIVWSVESGDAYASVDGGVVTGIAEGEAVIRATVQDTEIYAECTVTVTPAAAPDTRKTAESPEGGFSSISGDLSGNEISFAAYQGGSANAPNGNNTAHELRLYKYQESTEYGGYVTITAKDGCTIDQVVITVGGNCKVGYCKDAEDFPTKEDTPISVGTSSPFDTGTGLNASSVNVVNLDGSNQFKIKTITVYYTGEAVTLQSVAISGTASVLEYTEGQDFNPAGLAVTGTYSDASTAPISEGITWAYDPSPLTVGTTSVSVTATVGEISSSAFVVNGLTVSAAPVPTSGNIVILAEYNSKFYAMTNSLTSGALAGVEVEKDGSKIVVSSAEDKAAIQWTATVDGDNTTLKDGDDYYIKGSSGASLSLEADPYNWNWDGEKSCYISSAYTNRGLFFSNSGNVFKGYALSNITSDGYAATEVIEIDPEDIVISSKVDPALAYTPASDEITVGDAWSAPVLGYVEGFDGLAAITYESSNEAVATVTDAGVIALAGGTGTATITATFAGNASYLAGSATYTVKVNEPAEDCDGTDDFSTATSESASSYNVERTTTNGWSSVNSALTTINSEARWLTMLGKTSQVGVITSPTLNDGIASLKIRYANTFNESNGVSFRVDIKQGEDVVETYTITKENSEVAKGTVYTELIENINVAGNFQIIITNLCPSNADSNKDRVSIGRLCWSSYSAPEPPTPQYETVRGSLTAGNYYTVCFNKTMTAIQGASLWSFIGKDANMAYIEQAEAPYAAGTPYLIYAESDKLEALTEEVANPQAGSNNGLYGTFSYMDADALSTAGATYMLKNNELRLLGSNNHLDAYRAYVILNEIPGGEPAPAPGRRVRAIPMQQNGATGFENIEASEKPMKLMIDGQIYILRGEKMYDATGRLVK